MNERKPEDYQRAAGDSLELAHVLAGQTQVGKWAIEVRRRWEESKFFKLWQQEQDAGRDPHRAFEQRGWEP